MEVENPKNRRNDQDPARNLPVEVFHLLLQHLDSYQDSEDLKTTCHVSRQWYDVVSNSKRFKDNRGYCKFKFAAEESNFNSLVDVNPEKFKKIKVTSSEFNGYTIDDDLVKKFHYGHIKQMTKFSEYLTVLFFDDLILKRRALISFLEFIASCHNLKDLSLSKIRREQHSCSTVAPVKLPDLEHFHEASSDWILQHLKCDRIEKLTIGNINVDGNYFFNNSPIEFEPDSSSIVKFMNSIVQLNRLKLDAIDLANTVETLSPKFKWKTLNYYHQDLDEYFLDDNSFHTNWLLLLGAAESDATLIISFRFGTSYFGRFLNMLSESAGLSKLEVFVDWPDCFDSFEGYDENKIVRSVKHLKANLDIGEGFSQEAWLTFNEKFLRLFPNAETLDLEYPFEIRSEMSSAVFKSVKKFKITWWSQTFAEYLMPNLEHVEITVINFCYYMKTAEFKHLEKFLSNQVNLKSFTAKSYRCMSASKKENAKLRLQNRFPNLEVVIE